MLSLEMCHQTTRRHPHPTVRALHPTPQYLSVRGSDPRQSPCVRQLRKYDRGVTGPVGHNHCILHVCEETDLVEEVCEDVECYLQPIRPGQRNQPVICIEESRQLLDCLPNSFHSRLCWRRHCHPVPDHGVHHNVEKRGGKGSPWVTPWYTWNGGGKLSVRLHYHIQSSPVRMQKTEHLRSLAVSCQDV